LPAIASRPAGIAEASSHLHRLHDGAARPSHIGTYNGTATGASGALLQWERHMLKWAIVLAIVSIVTGWLGFGTLSGVTGAIAKVLFAIFIILFLLALLAVFGIIHMA